MVHPSVTVFIPTYNRLPLLKRAVASVLEQGDLVRLHILDNASTDGTAEWLRQLESENPRVDLTLRSHNIGPLQSYVEGFNSATTPYIVPLADDDELVPGYLPSALLALAKYEENIGAIVFRTSCQQSGHEFALNPENPSDGYKSVSDHLPFWAENGPYISWSSIVWNASIVRQTGAVQKLPEFGLPSDIWFQFMVFSAAPVVLSPQIGTVYNFHPSQAWRAISLHTLPEYCAIIKAIQKRLVQIKIPEQLLVSILSALVSKFNKLILSNTKGHDQSPSISDLKSLLAIYTDIMFSINGFQDFPFTPMIPEAVATNRELNKTRQLYNEATENLSKVELELSLMKSSLSWKFTRPFRAMDAHLRTLLKRP